MSYIVPREKPKCYNCPFRTLDYCGLLIEHDCVTVNVNEMTVSKYCPLVEIPTPHGRLGDLDKLKADHSMKNDCAECEKELQGSSRACEYDRIYSKMDFCQWIDNAETVIEPEGRDMMDEEIRQALSEVREMKQMCGNINMKLTNIVTQRGRDWKAKLEAEYQRGLEDGKAVYDKECEGCMYQDKTTEHHLCGVCCNAYNNMWTAKQTDDEIKVGDEVRGINGNEKLIITAIESEYDHCVVMTKRGGYYTANLSSLVKTGRHFDIASILKEMQS